MLLAAGRRAAGAAGVAGAPARSAGWSHTSAPLPRSGCARAACCTASWTALERGGKGTARLAPVQAGRESVTNAGQRKGQPGHGQKRELSWMLNPPRAPKG